MNKLLLVVLVFFCVAGVEAKVVTQEVEYSLDETTFVGFLAYDDVHKEKRPGILVVHEWWGHNDYARKRAIRLAEMGYVALAVDMYGEGKVAAHPQEAGAFANAVMSNLDSAKARFMLAMDILEQNSFVDSDNIGAIGYCFGGATVLNMARMGLALKGVVSFHGSLTSSVKAIPGDVKAKILVCNGADDEFITQEIIDGFKEEMDVAQASYEFNNYPGARHSFTNSDADKYAQEFNLPLAYHPLADEQSWQDMQEFFDSVFSK